MAWRSWGLPIAVLAVLAWLMSARWELPAAAMDEGMLLVYPEQILHGRVPYRDFDTAYGPANPYLLAGVFALADPGILAERAVGFTCRLAILVAVWLLSRRWGATAGAGAMLLAGVFLIPTNLVAYAWLGGLVCLLWAIWLAIEEGRRWRKLAAGLLAAVALLFRPDLGLAVLMPMLVLAWSMPARERKLMAAGAVCGLAPLAWLAIAVGPVRLYQNLFHFPVLHSGRQIPIEPGWMLSLLCLHFAGAGLAAGFGWLALRADPRDARGRTLFALGLCALGCSHQGLQRFDQIHLFFTCFLSIGLLPLAFLTALELRGRPAPHHPLAATAAALLLVTIASPPMIGCLRQAIGFRTGAVTAIAPAAIWNARTFPLRSTREVERLTRCLDAVQRSATPGERLFVGPRALRHPHYNDTFLYHLLPHLTPATYFLEMNPGSVDRPGSQLATDIASADWLILNRDWDALTGATGEPPVAAEEIVRTSFALVCEAGGLSVHRRIAAVAGPPSP